MCPHQGAARGFIFAISDVEAAVWNQTQRKPFVLGWLLYSFLDKIDIVKHTTLLATVTASVLLLSSSAWGSPVEHGAALSGQPGVVRALSATPSIHRSWLLTLGSTYGWEANNLEEGDSRQQTNARFVLSFAPWRFLHLALSAGTSIDGYAWSDPANSSIVVGALGDPRISIRTGWSLGDSGVSLGALVDVWFPSGAGSFNVVGGAISPTIMAMFSFAPERIPIGLHINVGYRNDRTINMLGDISQLSQEQLLLSGATSAMHGLIANLAFEGRVGPAAPYLEVTSDLSVADGIEHSHAMLGFGSRFYVGPADAVQLLIGMDFRVTPTEPSPNPATSTIWRSPPLLNVHVGVSFRLPVVTPEGSTVVTSGGPVTGGTSDDEDEELGRINGVVRCADGPCGPSARVRISGLGSSAMAPDDRDGGFSTSEIPPGAYTVEVSASGRAGQSRQVEVEAGETARVEFTLAAAAPTEASGIRGQVTNFQGQAVQATIRIPALELELNSGEDGNFETEADPGAYEIIVSAPDYGTQHTSIEVPPEGMVIMNIELRAR